MVTQMQVALGQVVVLVNHCYQELVKPQKKALVAPPDRPESRK